MKIARSHIIAVMEMADNSNDWVEWTFKKYVLAVRKFKTGWKVKFWPNVS